jgi:acetyl-CoA acetyltransferase
MSCGIWDGLTDAYCGLIMGLTAENLAAKYKISRKEQDEVALRSHNNAEAAIKAGKFKDEILPIKVKTQEVSEDGQVKFRDFVFDTDEGPRYRSQGHAKLKSVFKENGVVTAANSSKISDGASALVLMSKEKALALL